MKLFIYHQSNLELNFEMIFADSIEEARAILIELITKCCDDLTPPPHFIDRINDNSNWEIHDIVKGIVNIL